MIIGACTLHLSLTGVMSLKEKRGLLKPLLVHLRKRFEVAAAEVGQQDNWQTAEVAVVTVANDSAHVYEVLDTLVAWIEEEYRAVDLIKWETELR